MKIWIARDENGDLKGHWEKPKRKYMYDGTPGFWFSSDWINIPNYMFDGLDWGDEPYQTKVTFKDMSKEEVTR